MGYLRSLPGYTVQQPVALSESVRELHGYIEMMTRPAFQASADRVATWEAWDMKDRLDAVLPLPSPSSELKKRDRL